MFRRNRTEDYDEYNERVNAKYDDDYVREEKEYRDECTHSHEQTYEDENYVDDRYTTVRNNTAETQTTADYREYGSDKQNSTYKTDQHEYEVDAAERSFYSSKLQSGENLIYVGKTRILGSAKGCVTTFMVFFGLAFGINIIRWLIASLAMIGHEPVAAVFSLIPILFTVVILSVIVKSFSNLNGSFAITDTRLIQMRGRRVSSQKLERISSVAINEIPNTSQVAVRTANISYQYNGAHMMLFGVEEPERAYNILVHASEDARSHRS